MSELKGIIPAIVTPVDDQERFDAPAFERLAARLYAAGVYGLYVCGQTGEGLQQSAEQRKRVAETAVSCSPKDKAVIIHVGSLATAEAVDLARHAARIGARAVSSLPPAGSYSFGEIRDYYATLAAASELPVIVYYFPSFAPAIRTTAEVIELTRIPNVAGIKFTDSDMFRLWCIHQTGTVVFNGSDEMLVAGLIMGANGGIGSIYNCIPEEFVALYRHTVAGEWEQARAVQDRINEFTAVILRYPVNTSVKFLLACAGLDCGPPIAPRRRLTPAEAVDLRDRIGRTVLGAAMFGAPAAQ